jgi:methionyl-tRNA synthetase
LGNFVNRIAKFCTARLGGEVPEKGEYGALEAETTSALEKRLATLTAQLEAMEFRKSAIELRSMWVIGNEYLQKAEPWMKIKTDPVSAGVSIRYALNLAIVFAALAQPFVPDVSAKIRKALSGREGSLAWPTKLEDTLNRGAAITVPDVLFAKVEDEQLAAWIERFGGADKKNGPLTP